VESFKLAKGNQNPEIEEEQTTQWSKEKGQKDKQQSTKHEADLSELVLSFNTYHIIRK
jgi:hypothetical protein